MATYDPYKPLVVGPSQLCPVTARTLALDTGSETGYRFVNESGSSVTMAWARLLSAEPPAADMPNVKISARVYAGGGPLVNAGSTVHTITIPCTSGYLGTNATLTGSSIQAAVANPSDDYYVELVDNLSYAHFWFGTDADPVTSVLSWDSSPGCLILDVSVMYIVTGPFDNDPGNNYVRCRYGRAGTTYEVWGDEITGPDDNASPKVRRVRGGDLDYYCDASTQGVYSPWVHRTADDSGLYAMRSSGASPAHFINFITSADTAGHYQLRYVALMVTYLPSTSFVAGGGVSLSDGVDVAEGLYAYTVPLFEVPNVRDSGTSTEYLYDLSQNESAVITFGRTRNSTIVAGS